MNTLQEAVSKAYSQNCLAFYDREEISLTVRWVNDRPQLVTDFINDPEHYEVIRNPIKKRAKIFYRIDRK